MAVVGPYGLHRGARRRRAHCSRPCGRSTRRPLARCGGRVPGPARAPPVLAVDATRLAAVAQWRRVVRARLDDIAGAAAPAGSRQPAYAGRVLRLTWPPTRARLRRPGARRDVITPDGRSRYVPLARCATGRRLSRRECRRCRNGCLLAALKLVIARRPLGAALRLARVPLAAVDGRPSPTGVRRAGDWRADVDPSLTRAHVGPARRGVREPDRPAARLQRGPGARPGARQGRRAGRAPVAVAGAPPLEPVAATPRAGSGTQRQLREGIRRGYLAAAPRLGTTGLVADLETACGSRRRRLVGVLRGVGRRRRRSRRGRSRTSARGRAARRRPRRPRRADVGPGSRRHRSRPAPARGRRCGGAGALDLGGRALRPVHGTPARLRGRRTANGGGSGERLAEGLGPRVRRSGRRRCRLRPRAVR
jgi:hypothetical protein